MELSDSIELMLATGMMLVFLYVHSFVCGMVIKAQAMDNLEYLHTRGPMVGGREKLTPSSYGKSLLTSVTPQPEITSGTLPLGRFTPMHPRQL